MFKNYLVVAFIITIITFLTSCRSINSTNENLIQDLINIKQDHKNYIQNGNSETPLIPLSYQKIQTKQYIKKILSPWNASKNFASKSNIEKEFIKLSKGNIYAENKQKIDPEWINRIKENANLKKFPNYFKKGITIANTSIRLLPTKKPIFSKFSDNSNGFPFDNLQNSKLPANTPIFISHITKDNAWVYVETAFAHGWVPIRDIAYAGPKFIREFKKYSTYVSLIKDDISIKTIQGTYLYQGFIGMSFPLIKEFKTYYQIITARPSATRYAYVTKSKLFKSSSIKKPFPFSATNVAKLCNNLIDQPYGWGGLFNNRDCSAMIRDLFAPFSIWLPRNSASQAKQGGTFIDVSFMTDKNKEQFIIDNATPYATLLWFPGHIMLYIGQAQHKSLVFHNIWGIRTKDKLKRKIIGKAVITTLTPGTELENFDEDYNFLSRIEGMTLLTPRY